MLLNSFEAGRYDDDSILVRNPANGKQGLFSDREYSIVKFLKENEHYVSPNFKGYNYLLIMLMQHSVHLFLIIILTLLFIFYHTIKLLIFIII